MDSALNNLWRLICHNPLKKTNKQTNKKTNKCIFILTNFYLKAFLVHTHLRLRDVILILAEKSPVGRDFNIIQNMNFFGEKEKSHDFAGWGELE